MKTIEQRLEDLSALTPDELSQLDADIRVAFATADANDDVDAMEDCVSHLEQLEAHVKSLATEESESEAEKPETDEAEQPAEAEPTPEPITAETKDEEPAPAEPEAEVKETAKETPAEEPEAKNDTPDEVATVTEIDAKTEIDPTAKDATSEAHADKEQTAMAASADFSPPEEHQPLVASASTQVVVGNDIPGFTPGADFSDLPSVNEAFLQRLTAVKRGGGHGGDGEQYTVASVVASIPEDRMLAPGDIEGNARKIESVTGEQAIVASGGYCAPLAVKYDIFGLGSTVRPVRDSLPTFGATRGGIRYVAPPVLGGYGGAIGLWSAAADVIAGTTQVITNKELTSNVATLTTSAPHGYVVGQTATVAGVGAPFDGTYLITAVPTATTFSYARTNANVASAAVTPNGSANQVKPCLKVTCAAEQTAVTDAITLCLVFGNLMTRAYPELVQRHTQLALVQHARFAEQNLLAQIGALSTAVTSAFRLGTTRDFLLAIGKASAAYRNRHRVARTTPLRVIAPEWVLDAMREDIAMAMPPSELATADSVITSYLAARNVNVTWHMDDLFAAQGAGAIVDFPATIKWFIFAEGTFILLDGGTLDLGVVRDSGLVGTNDYKTFVETFEGIAKVGIESIQVTTTTHAAGGSVGTVAVS